ncbi:outer membrane beta-barrel protein [Vibrio sp. OCN044]|uniref:Outer membrane beta-barrel protein n=1 Tax=Vibrio tetraodonis subsp. pristinus TaxID=2695891 RepID=A0A6L8LP50_9VIBR|nr:outer membrane beta-barrel protein [Vibrio tetraodonis]MYM57655.1 outer membrane beta-barrel protein [Vibrio tetraodonis subsp. pristinus]
MKKAVLAAFVAAASFQAVGAENIGSQHGYLDEGWYIGADIIDTTYKSDELDGSPSSTSGAISIGYDFKLADSVVLGVETEYADYGKFDFPITDRSSQNVHIKQIFSHDVQAISFYLKPKYFVSNSPFYIGALVGIGMYKVKSEIDTTGTLTINTFQITRSEKVSDNESETEFVYGLETGYALNNNIILNAGYRMANLKHYEHDTWYVGLDYKF